MPSSHHLAKHKQISLQSLANEPLIFYPRSLAPVFYAHFIQCCEQAGFLPNIVQEAELGQTRLGLASAGMGITFILSPLQNLNAKRVVYRPLDGNFPTLKLALAWRKNESSPVVHEFIKEVKSQKLEASR